MAQVYHLLRNEKDSIAHFNKAISINPDNTDYCIDLSILLEETGKYQEAVETLKKAIRIDPEKLKLYEQLSGVLEKLERYKDAVDIYKKFKKNNPYFLDEDYLCEKIDYLKRKFSSVKKYSLFNLFK